MRLTRWLQLQWASDQAWNVLEIVLPEEVDPDDEFWADEKPVARISEDGKVLLLEGLTEDAEEYVFGWAEAIAKPEPEETEVVEMIPGVIGWDL